MMKVCTSMHWQPECGATRRFNVDVPRPPGHRRLPVLMSERGRVLGLRLRLRDSDQPELQIQADDMQPGRHWQGEEEKLSMLRQCM